MNFFKLSIFGLFLCISLNTFSQIKKNPTFVKSNFREIETQCIKKKLKSYYDLSHFEIQSNYNNGVRFIFPGYNRYKWRVWKSTENSNYFVIISLDWDKKSGEVKSNKKACVTIDLTNGVIYDEMIAKRYTLFNDNEKVEKLKKKKKDDAAKYNTDVATK